MYKGKKESLEQQIDALTEQISNRKALTLEMESRLKRLKQRLVEMEQYDDKRHTRWRLAFNLRENEKLTYKEIGVRLGVGIETARQIVVRAQRYMRHQNKKMSCK